MEQDSELQRLERFVAKLLKNFSELRAEKAGLLQQLDERNRQIEELRGRLATEEMERGEIGQRVGKLVDQIEEWERNLNETAVDAPSPIFAEDVNESEEAVLEDYEVQEELEAVREEAEAFAAEPRGEEEVRVQHNLFSLTTHK